jgi:probable phosphoglycerate mutase
MRLQLPRTLPELDWVPFPEAESWRMMFRRLASYLDEVEARQTGPLVIVSHRNALVCIINWWLRLTDDRSLQDLMYDADPCSVTQLRIDRHGCRSIDRLNDTSHLFAWPEGCAP